MVTTAVTQNLRTPQPQRGNGSGSPFGEYDQVDSNQAPTLLGIQLSSVGFLLVFLGAQNLSAKKLFVGARVSKQS